MVVFLLVGGFIISLLLSGKKHDGQELSVQNLLSFDSSEITLGTRLFSFVDDKEFAFVVTSTELPDSEEFSLTKPASYSIQEAVACASNVLSNYVTIEDIPNWFVSCVTLKHCTASKWYYVVEYKPRNAIVSFDGSANKLRIPVQFDGRIPDGIERINTRKRRRDFRMAAEALGITTDELLQRGQEAEEELRSSKDLVFLSDVGSQVLKFELSNNQLEKSPPLDIYKPLPFCLHEAVAVAMNASRLYIPIGERSAWQIEEVSLKRWGLSKKWHYLVTFNVKNVVNMPIVKQLLIPVLINGETVKGQRIKTSL